MIFPERLKELRESKGLSQEDLAEILGIPRSTITHYETKDHIRMPRHERLQKIADFFGVSVDYLLGRTNDPSISIEKRVGFKPSSRDMKDLKKFLDQAEVMYDGVPISKESKEKVKAMLEGFFWEAKQMNKRKKKGNIENGNRET